MIFEDWELMEEYSLQKGFCPHWIKTKKTTKKSYQKRPANKTFERFA
jgi:hypothetical protein